MSESGKFGTNSHCLWQMPSLPEYLRLIHVFIQNFVHHGCGVAWDSNTLNNGKLFKVFFFMTSDYRCVHLLYVYYVQCQFLLYKSLILSQ
jgi:hypothetical protein